MSLDSSRINSLFIDPKWKCTGCGIESNYWCGVCRFAYCSQKCQKQHWPAHKIMCAKWKWQRLSKFIAYFKSHESKRHLSISLSVDTVWIQTKFCAFGISALPGIDGGSHRICAICENSVNYDGPYNMAEFDDQKFRIDYYRCKSCHAKGLKLDMYTLMDSQELRYYLLLCLQRLVTSGLIRSISRDVRRLICSYVYLINTGTREAWVMSKN